MKVFQLKAIFILRIKESVIDFSFSAVNNNNFWSFKASLGFYIIVSTKVSVINNKLPLPLYKALFQTVIGYIFSWYTFIYIIFLQVITDFQNSLFLVPDGMEIAVFFLEFQNNFLELLWLDYALCKLLIPLIPCPTPLDISFKTMKTAWQTEDNHFKAAGL